MEGGVTMGGAMTYTQYWAITSYWGFYTVLFSSVQLETTASISKLDYRSQPYTSRYLVSRLAGWLCVCVLLRIHSCALLPVDGRFWILFCTTLMVQLSHTIFGPTFEMLSIPSKRLP